MTFLLPLMAGTVSLLLAAAVSQPAPARARRRRLPPPKPRPTPRRPRADQREADALPPSPPPPPSRRQQQLQRDAKDRAELAEWQRRAKLKRDQDARAVLEERRLKALQDARDAAEEKRLEEEERARAAAEKQRLADEEQARADAAARAAEDAARKRTQVPVEPLPPPPPPPTPKKKPTAAEVKPVVVIPPPTPEPPPPAPPSAPRPREAAERLWKFASMKLQAGQYGALGTKGNPSEMVAFFQLHMKRLKSDGQYGPKTRARGKELLGREFPIRRRQPTVAPAPAPVVDEVPPQERGEVPPLPPPPAPPPQTKPTPAVAHVEVTQRSPAQAAADLLAYVRALGTTGRGAALGFKGHPNETVREAQADMGGLKADGFYGNKTRRRGRALTGESFPPR